MTNKKSKDPLSPMREPEVKTTELGFVTSVNEETRTFFVQLCKFTNIDLIQFNQAINNHCNKKLPERSMPSKIHKGSLVCARFSQDGFWYRALVINRDEKMQTYRVLFVDYGNVETIQLEDFLQVSGAELPEMDRAPFGISCFFKGSDLYPQTHAVRFLECICQNYVMIRIVERQSRLQWMVEIPRNAYNRPFWTSFSGGKTIVTQENGQLGYQSETQTNTVCHEGPLRSLPVVSK